MENVNAVLGANILRYRKQKGLTQEELAEAMGVSCQAVSKWETAKSAPDISFLPRMAELFECYIDELFSREVVTEKHYDHCPQFPWPDDTVIRGVVCEGRKILCQSPLTERFTFAVEGDVKSVQSECNVEVRGNVSGGCKAGGNVNVAGPLSGGCMANGSVVIGGHLSGGCNAGGSLTVKGNFSGGCNAGKEIVCGGNLSGDVNCRELVVHGNVKAERIKGNVTCRLLECDLVKGNVAPAKSEGE